MEIISNLMFWISNGLLIPVVVGLLFFFIQSIFMLGSLFNKLQQRRKQDVALRELPALQQHNIDDLKAMLEQCPASKFSETCAVLLQDGASSAHRMRQISQFEIDMDKEIGRSKMLTKFGPILGLMGTLIPMGPALVGLSTGDIGSMAYNMQIVFATTVLGLFAGGVGFVLVQIRQRWLMTDLTNLDFIADLLTQPSTPTSCVKEEE